MVTIKSESIGYGGGEWRKWYLPQALIKIICFSGTVSNGEKKEISNTSPLMLLKKLNLSCILTRNPFTNAQEKSHLSTIILNTEWKASLWLSLFFSGHIHHRWMRSFIHLFNKYLLDVHHVSGILSSTGIQEWWI